MPDAVSAARGVHKPRRPQASPLFRLVSDHLQLAAANHLDPSPVQLAATLMPLGSVLRGFCCKQLRAITFLRVPCDTAILPATSLGHPGRSARPHLLERTAAFPEARVGRPAQP